MDVSRIYLFEIRRLPGGTVHMFQRHEWAAPGVVPQIDNPDTQDVAFEDIGLGGARARFERNEVYGGIVSELPEAERLTLDAQDIRSLIALPIYVEDAWWGFIGLDECRSARVFTPAEVAGLRAAAGLFGSAIQHQMLEEARRQRGAQEAVLRAQEAALLELSTPLLPVHEGVLVMPLVGSVDARRAERVLEVLLRGVAERRARVAIIDVTGIPTMDPSLADALVRAAKGAALLGAQAILTGIRPEVAQTLVGLGADLGGVVTSSSLDTAMAMAISRAGSLGGTRP
jgi:anti-anti-sigma regulatory factor